MDFVRLQKDKRIRHLRTLVSEATRDGVSFDKEFYIQTLRQLLDASKQIEHVRHRTAWLTAPLLLLELLHIPGGLGREAMTEGAGWFKKATAQKKHQWLLLLADMHKQRVK